MTTAALFLLLASFGQPPKPHPPAAIGTWVVVVDAVGKVHRGRIDPQMAYPPPGHSFVLVPPAAIDEAGNAVWILYAGNRYRAVVYMRQLNVGGGMVSQVRTDLVITRAVYDN